MYQPGKNNILAETLSKALCRAAVNKEKLADLHTHFCYPGMTRPPHPY